MAKDEKNKKNKNVKEPKKGFFKESKAELKKVTWPTPKNLANDTATVIGIVLVVAIIVVILDFIFLNINENVIIKAEERVKNSHNNTSVVTDVVTDNTTNVESTEGTGTENTVNAVNTENSTSEQQVPEETNNNAE